MTQNAKAILYMIAAMLVFTCVDAAVKVAGRFVSTGQLLLVVSIGSLLIFLPLLKLNGEAFFSRNVIHRAMIVRSLGELFAWFGLTEALRVAGLGTVTAVMQVQPLVVVLGAALFLAEPVGWRRWTAVLVGFVGVLVILGPSASGLNAGLFWTIPAILGLTMRDLASRVLPPGVSTSFAVSWAMVVIVAYSTGLVLFDGGWTPVAAEGWFWMAVLVVLTSLGMALITIAMRTGEASVVAPLRYTRIVFGLGLAYVFFREVPAPTIWLGAVLIVGAGLYSYWREMRAKPAA
ncbi:MAG: DMT family transporter [Paracoccaceae bacterium]